MAELTMRRLIPPAFINSPASMKKGTAINGKLSAPLIKFCDTIWVSKLSKCNISATPDTIREKARGMPKAMAANKEPMKTKTVIWRSLANAVWRLLQSL